MNSPLQREAANWEHMKRRLLAQMPELEEDEVALFDTLEGLTDLHEQLAELIRSALQDEANAAGMKDYLAKLTDRKSHLTARAQKKREIVRHYMELTGLHRLNIPDMTVTRAATPPGVQIIDLDQLPDEFVRVKREADKTAIKAALKEGRDVPGAVRTNAGETLKIRI